MTSPPTLVQRPLEVGLSRPRRINAARLREEALDHNAPTLDFLPVLGQGGSFVSGFSHLLSAYPKTGKTTLLATLALEWSEAGATVLYITEEPEAVWRARLRALPGRWEGVELFLALGLGSNDLRAEIEQCTETIVILDTIRLLQLRDENDNAQINIALTPFIATCRGSSKTLILAHHTSKAGGAFGTAAAGGHAFAGIVDVVLELLRDGNSPNRRKLQGWARIIEVSELLYEKQGDKLVSLGNPRDVILDAVMDRAWEALTGEWQTTKAVRHCIGFPPPSDEQLRAALDRLTSQGKAERNPREQRKGATYRWRRHLTSNNGY